MRYGTPTDRPDPYPQLLRQGVVFVQGTLDDTRANSVIGQLLLADRQAPTEALSMYINSSGGDLRAALAIYDAMQVSAREISTLCLGTAAGPAVLLLAAGAPGRRFAHPHARVGILRPGGSLQGTAAEIDVRSRELLKLRQQFNELLAHHTGKSAAQIEQDADRGIWLGTEEAKDYGVIDSIVASDHRT